MSAVVRHPEVQVFDLRGEPHRLSAGEWSPTVARDPATFRGVAVHAWGVRDVDTEGRLRARYGEPLALARRALATPYTVCAGVTRIGRVPVVSIAHPLERYTHASDAGNAQYLSVGVMGLFAFEAESTTGRHTPVTDELRAAVDVALEVAVRLLSEHAQGPFELITHRQCANQRRDHVACPGEAVVEMALASRVVDLGMLLPMPDQRLRPPHSKAWPDAWRRHLPRPSASPAEREQEQAETHRGSPVDRA